jgi:hypothetical protein
MGTKMQGDGQEPRQTFRVAPKIATIRLGFRVHLGNPGSNGECGPAGVDARDRGRRTGSAWRIGRTMNDDLKFQLRLTLRDEFAHVARNDPADPSISTLANILSRHDAVMKCQFDAFADYVSEAEANGVENYHLYEWTKKTIEDPAKKAKYVKSFTLYVGGEEVYEKDKADELEAELKPLVGGPIVAKMFKYDTDPAHSPQPPHRG